MDFTEAVDLGDAPEIFLTGIKSVERLGPGTIRVSFYSQRDNCKRVVLHAVWDLQTWIEMAEQLNDIRGMMRYGPAQVDHCLAS
jgi:hypothetical protein